MALALAACSSASSGRPTFLLDLPKQADAFSSTQREHQRVLTAYGGAYRDPRLQAKLEGVVKRLVKASDSPDMAFTLTVLNSPAVNAFALPGGQLYVTRGLLSLANDSSELASVLSHEMAHVIARHAAIREEQARRTEVSDSENDASGDPQVGAMALARSKLAMASFSRAQEFEADEIGVGIAARSGYDPYGAARLLAAMGRNAELRVSGRGNGNHPVEFLSSHPTTPERVLSVENSARQYGPVGSGERDKADYLTSIDGMIYGDDPLDGFVRGRQYIHPRLGFAFTAPDGFTLDNTAQAVLGMKDGAGQALRFDVVKLPAEQSLAGYLGSGWVENIDQGSVEELTLNGFPAATATAKSDQWSFRVYAVRSGGDVYRFVFAAKNRTAEAERTFRDAVRTFRRLSPAETQLAKPLRLRIVKVAPGDSAESLASRMAAVDHAVERFRVLNGLDAKTRPVAGDLVKIITE
jgi:predicted Zn-dependent protease